MFATYLSQNVRFRATAGYSLRIIALVDSHQLKRALAVVLSAATLASAYGQPAVAWTRTTGLTLASQNTLRFVKTDGAGNTFVARVKGFRNTSAFQGYTQVQKFSPAGAALWSVDLVGQGSGVGGPTAMTVDNAGNVVLSDFDYYSLFQSGLTLTKLNGSNGAQLWKVTNFNFSFSVSSSIGCDSSNNVFVLGQNGITGDLRMGVTKFNGTTGATLWSKPVARVGAGQSDFASAMEVDASNNVAVVGTVRSTDTCNTTFKSPLVVGRLRGTDGATLWAKTYANNPATDDVNSPQLDVDTAGNVYVGAATTRVPSTVWTIAKFAAANGTLNFGKVFAPASTFLSFLSDVEADASGGFAFAGDAFGMTGGGVLVTRWTNAGAQSWSKMQLDRNLFSFFGLFSPNPHLVAQGASYYLVSTRDTTVGQNDTSVTMANKIAVSNGANTWERIYNGAANSKTTGNGIAVAPNGDALVINSVATGNMNNPNLQGSLVRMSSANGTVLHNVIGANAVIGTPDYGRDVVVDPSGFVYTTGGSAGRILTQKFNSAGTLIWQNIYDDGSVTQYSEANGGGIFITRDPSGNILVLGENRGDAVVLKLSNSTGGALWAKRFNGTAGHNLATAPNGDVFLPMLSPSQVLRLATGIGSTTWTSMVDPPGLSDSCLYVAVDSAGNPFVTGQTINTTACPSEPDEKVFVQKMNPTTGAKVWLTTLATANAGHNEPAGLGVDSSKNVLVGGTSENATNTDFFGAKLNGTSGAVLWNTKHDYSNQYQYATAMVVDGANNLLVTGGNYNTTALEAFTIKILGSNGARSWTNRLTTPAGNKFATDIARDSSNNVYVGGGIGTSTTGQRFGLKLNASSGAVLYNVVSGNALGSLGLFSTGVAVSSTNRMHLVGAVTSAGTGLANQVLTQYNP